MKILVTGVGAIIGQGILKSLKDYGSELHGMDIFEHAYGQSLCMSFHKAERADSPNYFSFIEALHAKYQFDLVIPGIEQDMYALHSLKAKLKCKILLNNDLLIGLSKDKWKTFEYFKNVDGWPLIPTQLHNSFEILKDGLGLPFLMKPKFSYASKSIHTIKDKYDFDYFTKGQESSSIFQKIVGSQTEEFTLHLFGDGKGGVLDQIVMNRSLSKEGATSIAEYSEDKNLNEYCKKIAQVTKPLGPTNVQVMRDNGVIRLLEINPRLSSACSIATLMGYNAPQHALDFFVKKVPLKIQKKRHLKVVRHIDDWIFKEIS